MEVFTTGDIARQQNLPEWRVRRTLDAVMPDAPRVGRFRVVPSDRLPEITAALAKYAPMTSSKAAGGAA